MTSRCGPTKPAKRKRAIKRQRKAAIAHTKAVIRAERRASVVISNRWLGT